MRAPVCSGGSRRRASKTETWVRAHPAAGLGVRRERERERDTGNAAAGAGNDGGEQEGTSLIL